MPFVGERQAADWWEEKSVTRSTYSIAVSGFSFSPPALEQGIN